MRLMRIVDVIPKSDSDEITSDTEPSIAVNASDPRQIVVTAFSQAISGSSKSPFFFSNDGGESWTVQNDVDSGIGATTPFITNDWTEAYGTASNLLYVGLLRSDDVSLNIYRGTDPTNSATFISLTHPAKDGPDQPWTTCLTSSDGHDRLYVGYNNSSSQATVLVSLNADATKPDFSQVRLDNRSSRADLPAVRPAPHLDGTVYAAFMSRRVDNLVEVTVTRDDNEGKNGFTDLTDPVDGKNGRIVAVINPDVAEGDQRNRTGLDLQVDPNNSDTIYVAYIDSTTVTNQVNVKRSTNRGKDWSNALVTDTDCAISTLAVNSLGTVALSYAKYLSAPDQWEIHVRTSSDGTNWDDTILSRTQAAHPGFDPAIGDYMRMNAVGPHFYGVLPASNVPGRAGFFPNGGGTMQYLRNISADGKTLLKSDGTTNLGETVAQSIDPFFFKIEQRDVTVLLMRNPMSQQEVDSRRKATGQAIIRNAVRVIVDGYTANELNLHGPNDVLNIPSPVEGLQLICTGNVPGTGTWNNTFQRFTFNYDLNFVNDDPFNFNGDSSPVTIIATAASGLISASNSASLTLIKNPDAFILHGDTAWLSVDLRVFSVQAGQQLFSGRPWTVSDAAGCPAYIQTVMNHISADDFDTQLQTSEDLSKLYTQETDGLGHDVFNFALAKVHYIGANPTPFDIRVFFRLFQAQTASSVFDFTPGQPATQAARYRRGTNGNGDAIPLAGFQGGEYVTLPFFATPRVDSTTHSMTTQTDPPNKRTITPRADGGEVIQFFGCWLDINQPTRVGSSGLLEQNNVIPVHVPATGVDGPFTTNALPLQSLVRATHHCLVAEIDYTPTPIPIGEDPSSWDKLAQRNITYSDAGSGTAVTPFEFDLTSQALFDNSGRPDEIMIEWGNTRADAPAQIYLPGIDVAQVLSLASQSYYPTSSLKRVDDHTLSCRVGGISYIPIPPTAQRFSNIGQPGLLSIDMPDSLRQGELFNIVISQVTSNFTRVVRPPALAIQSAEKPSALVASNSDGFWWRQVIGSFQMTIPVKSHNEILPRAINDLAFMLYVARSIPGTSRWYDIFQRYIKILKGRVDAFGGDSSGVGASATGKNDDDQECCRCCRNPHRRDCKHFRGCAKHPVGNIGDLSECCECCKNQHRPRCKLFKECARHRRDQGVDRDAGGCCRCCERRHRRSCRHFEECDKHSAC